MPDAPYVSINPAIQYGQPCIGGTRITTETLAGRIWAGDTVDDTADDFGLGREAVLLACWYEATLRPGYAQWGEWWRWAQDALHLMAANRWGDIPDPPSREAPR